MVRLKKSFDIADQLHDDLMPYLFAAAASLDAVRRNDPRIAESLEEPARLLDQARAIAKRILNHSLTPSMDQGGPLVAAKDFIESLPPVLNDSGEATSVHWDGLGVPSEVSPTHEQQVAIYRIVIEAVRNALRHASARRIDIDARLLDRQWLITVSDNGTGFDTSIEPVHDESTGLKRIVERAAIIPGLRLRVDSELGVGTRVQLSCK